MSSINYIDIYDSAISTVKKAGRLLLKAGVVRDRDETVERSAKGKMDLKVISNGSRFGYQYRPIH
jgi:hypothetical protein